MSPPPVASGPLLSLLAPFAVAFTAPTLRHVLVPVSGTILASGRRTVVAALRAVAHGERGGAGQAPSAESPFTIWMNRSSPFVPPFTAIRTPRHSPARARSAQFISGAGAASQRIRWSVK